MRSIIATGDYIIEPTEKNKYFDRMFPLTARQKCDVLRSLNADDCYSIEPNNNPRYKTDTVYKFLKDIDMLAYGENMRVKLYIKSYIRELKSYDMVVIISFHEEGMYDERIS